MTSIPVVVETIVRKQPFLEYALLEGIVNLSALARWLRPEVERQAGRPVNEGAIMMALKRMGSRLELLSNMRFRRVIGHLGDVVVRSNLADLTYRNSPSLFRCQARLLEHVHESKEAFCTFSQGVGETAIVLSHSLVAAAEEIFRDERQVAKSDSLSSITLKLPAENSLYPGVYYYIFKELAWDNINMVELISTTNEFTVVVHDDDIHRAFSILMDVKRGAAL
ncbi:aspartate kinase [uncultured Rikenella sp.]|uniref:aspartate kinase n=1 Tax=uncultured Rikenella sp. TaxID=368003 RepID=UPI0025D97E3F|nr:aspartate kinase [uncultured Rikenella sp.]